MLHVIGAKGKEEHENRFGRRVPPISIAKRAYVFSSPTKRADMK